MIIIYNMYIFGWAKQSKGWLFLFRLLVKVRAEPKTQYQILQLPYLALMVKISYPKGETIISTNSTHMQLGIDSNQNLNQMNDIINNNNYLIIILIIHFYQGPPP